MFVSLHKPLWLAGLAALVVLPAAADAAPRVRVVVPAHRPTVVRPAGQITPPAPIPAVRPIPPIGRDPRTWSPYPPIPGRDPRTWSPYPLYPPYQGWWGYYPYPWIPDWHCLPGNPYLGD